MASRSKPPKRVPLGAPLPSSEAALDALVVYGEADIARAVADWQANAPRRARGLVEAEEVPADANQAAA